jgi:HKD family nuclease
MSDMVWDENKKRWKSGREVELEQLKQKIIQELLDQLTNNYEINVTIDFKTGKGIIKLKKVK